MKRMFHRKLSPVIRISGGGVSFGPRNNIRGKTLFLLFIVFVSICSVILAARLFQLTVTKGGYYKRLSEANRIREVLIEPQYGTIRDRKGYILAQNKQSPTSSKDMLIRSERDYANPFETAHILGYRRIANEDDLKNDNCERKLVSGEKIGKKGVQEAFDCELRGRPGRKLIEINAQGKEEGVIAVVPPVSGKDIQISLDSELQIAAYNALKGRKGAVIATKPSTGEILVFVSSPSYNPELFETGDARVRTYFSDTEKPMLNRATEAVYQPGSVFKPIIAVGGLHDGVISHTDIIQDNGFIMAGSLKFGNWYYLQYGKTEGPVDIEKAIRRSNDTYFYKLGEKMGPEKIRTWAELFGIGEKVPFEFEQADGTLPSPFWKNENLHEKWYLGDTYNYSIGQGYLLTTPLQIHYAMNAFAVPKTLCSPHLLKGQKPSCVQLPVSGEAINIVREGMRQACSTGGTGWPLFEYRVHDKARIAKELDALSPDRRASAEASMNRNPNYMIPIQTGCKTGTAESHARSGIPHAWFTVFAPFEKPEILITVLLEEAGQGSDIAAPVAKEVLTSYFERVQ